MSSGKTIWYGTSIMLRARKYTPGLYSFEDSYFMKTSRSIGNTKATGRMEV